MVVEDLGQEPVELDIEPGRLAVVSPGRRRALPVQVDFDSRDLLLRPGALGEAPGDEGLDRGPHVEELRDLTPGEHP